MKTLLEKKDIQSITSFEDIGYVYFGPLVFSFFEWLKDELIDCELVLFNSREGYFLNKIYKIFQKKYNLPKSLYFKTSRKLSAISSFKTEKDIYNTFSLHRYSGTLSSLLKDRFELDIKIHSDYEIDTVIQIPDLTPYISTILKKSEYVRLEYEKYIKNCIKNSKNIAMVDSGFQGTTQYYLEKAFGLNFNGKYITYKGNIPHLNGRGFLNFETTNFKNNIIFFESVFIDKVGSFVDIQNGNFINEDFNEHTNYFNKKSKIINGIKLFIKDANKIKYKLENSIFVDNNFNLMCKKGFIKNEKLFDIFLHDNYYVRNCVKKINRR
jgi:hypothetical protein